MSRAEEPTTAAEVMRRCLRHWDYSKDQIIPRCCLTGWEADLLVIKPSGWVEEVEIKVSASDFRAEWRKKADKHEDLLLGGCRLVGYSMFGGEMQFREAVDEQDPRLVRRDHKVFLRDQATLIRRFWFAMPATLAEKLLPEVPEQYGVLAIRPHFNDVLRAPKNLPHARKLTDAERLRALHSTYFRFWRLTLREPAAALEALDVVG